MTTKYTTLRGICAWPMVYEPDTAFGKSEWKINLYLQGEELQKFKDLGLLLTVKEDANGEYVTLRRINKRVFNDETTFFCPPEIRGQVNVLYTDKDGNQIRQFKKGDATFMKGEKKQIGNGSEVSVNISYYDTFKGKGHRMESVTVHNLVEYNKPSTQTEATRGIQSGEVERKEPIVKEVKKTISEDLNDILPF